MTTPRLVTQSSAMPTRKVQAQVLSGAFVSIAIFILSELDITVPQDVIGAAVVIVSFIASYFTKNEAV